MLIGVAAGVSPAVEGGTLIRAKAFPVIPRQKAVKKGLQTRLRVRHSRLRC